MSNNSLPQQRQENLKLPYLSREERLRAYQLLTSGTTHVWSKNKFQKDRALDILHTLIPLTQNDPYFLAHLTSYIVRNSKSKDLRVLTLHANSISSANGEPFSPGSKYYKPNLRYVSAAGVQTLDPKLAYRMIELGRLKYGVNEILNEAGHFPNFLKTALKKYVHYREENIKIMRGIKKVGLGMTMRRIYRGLHIAPTEEAAKILRWAQKDKEIEFDKPEFDFTGLSDLQIAKKIREEKLPVLGALGALEDTISPVIAVALLEQATGNQAVILRKTFEDAGVLEDKDVMKLYKSKIREAQTALDRAETVGKEASEKVKKVLMKARSETRKEEMADIGRIYVHLDVSGSMSRAIDYAKENAATIAEMINKPQENFRWGGFNVSGEIYPNPETFEKDAFKAVLFGKTAGGGTNAFALYDDARSFGAEVDIFISDGYHNTGDLAQKIRKYHEDNPSTKKPRAVVLIKISDDGWQPGSSEIIKQAYEGSGIPFAEMKSETLQSSSSVIEAVKHAIMGPMKVIQDIMETPLLCLPNWYFTDKTPNRHRQTT